MDDLQNGKKQMQTEDRDSAFESARSISKSPRNKLKNQVKYRSAEYKVKSRLLKFDSGKYGKMTGQELQAQVEKDLQKQVRHKVFKKKYGKT